MACAGRRRCFTDFRCVTYVAAQVTWTNSKILRLLTEIPLIFLQLPILHPKTTPSLSWQTLTLPTFLLRIPYVSQQPLNYGLGITNAHPTPLFPESPRRYRDGDHSRSPIKGLFQFGSRHKGSDSFIRCAVLRTLPQFGYRHHSSCWQWFRYQAQTKCRFAGTKEARQISWPVTNRFFRVSGGVNWFWFWTQGFWFFQGTYSKVVTTFFYYRYAWFPIHFSCLRSLRLFYHPPASPVLSKSPLLVHSFVVEPPQIYSPRVPLHSIPPRPVPFPMDPDTTPSPFHFHQRSLKMAWVRIRMLLTMSMNMTKHLQQALQRRLE